MQKILIIDDDPGILDAVSAMLDFEGYSVRTFEKGDEVVKRIGNDIPDLILLDLLLSGKDGRQVVEQLRGNSKTKAIPIIMLSAHPTAEEAAQKAGANDFLAKPFNIDDLLKLINKNIKSGKAG